MVVHSFRSRALSAPRLALAAFLVGILAPSVAAAVQSAELYRTQAYFYGRFEARIRFAPGEGVVSSFFLWRDGSSSTTSWNELDYEKINSTCHLQTNIWTGKGTQSAQLDTPTFNICSDYHTYAFEWTPDYIAWLIDGAQVRKVTGANVSEYTQNASQGMSMHFNTWAGNSTFGGTLDPSTLPVHEFISWVQYSSYSNGAFQMQWREDFNAASLPSGWATGTWASPFSLSTHSPSNVTFGGGIAVLSMTADNATGFTGTPPADASGGDTGGTSGTGGTPGTGGASATGGVSGTGGSPGAGGSSATGGAPGAGGRSATGGTPGNGGSTSTGGAVGAGGSSATGGVSGDGGSTATGGVSGTGGTGSLPTGGTSGTGGSSSTGGTPETGSGGGCSCRTAAGQSTGLGGTLALLLIGAARLRPRRSR
jgi:endo-1,3-1,4-beta-glycanase ExoK